MIIATALKDISSARENTLASLKCMSGNMKRFIILLCIIKIPILEVSY